MKIQLFCLDLFKNNYKLVDRGLQVTTPTSFFLFKFNYASSVLQKKKKKLIVIYSFMIFECCWHDILYFMLEWLNDDEQPWIHIVSRI